MLTKILLAVCFSVVASDTLDCSGRHRYSSHGTGYYPAADATGGTFYDRLGHPLHTLQDFLEGKAQWVSVAMDRYAHILYGKSLCIPQLNHKYNRVIPFKVVDSGSAVDHKGYGRIDICTRSQHDSYDSTINGPLTFVFHI
ncbi:Hypothetical predicted protein [Mytilus galloprovincialis]|uniref:Uncharacterized protein n=1 Tax=Mytilus galloprovincialis TaxID=29158 RepID=A0A8B6CDR7_MYTGA|nr:Hypothetical predicted protein [Mytilus galloprovincialis]